MRNYHFELNFKIDSESGRSVDLVANKGYAGYGDFLTLGQIDIDQNYAVTLITKNTYSLLHKSEDSSENNLSSSYVAIYKRPVRLESQIKF